MQTNKIVQSLIKKARSKENDKATNKSIDDISALSLYYMTDKNAWQLKMWFYPTNRSKTYNVAVTFEQVKKLIPIINSIGLIDDIFEDDEVQEKDEKGW